MDRLLGRACLILVLGSVVGCAGQDLAPGVTADSVLQLRPGMTYAEVVSVVGEPFEMDKLLPPRKDGALMIQGETAPTQNPSEGVVTLTYSRRPRWAFTFPMLWIHLKEGRVREIYAKRYVGFGFDDDGVYGFLEGEQPWGGGASFHETFVR